MDRSRSPRLEDDAQIRRARRPLLLATPKASSVVVALAIVYVLWGSTSPAMRVAVHSLPPWWMVSIRFSTAGTILWIWSRARGVPLPTRREVGFAALSGVLLLVLGNGVFAWVLQYIPSGIGSLFFALTPIWMAILGFVLYRERLAPLGALGLGLGIAGMLYLTSPGGNQHLPLLPAVLGVTTSLAWALGSIIQRQARASNLIQMSAIQMLVASAVLAIAAAATGERLTIAAFTPHALVALAYLIVFGSIVGFSAYLWLVYNVPTTLASTYAYVNPVVSLAIGIGVLHERGSWSLALGAAIIVTGVAAIALAPRPTLVPATR